LRIQFSGLSSKRGEAAGPAFQTQRRNSMKTIIASLIALSVLAGISAAPASAACSSDKWNDSGNYPVWKCS
jgi:hypothetical protein